MQTYKPETLPRQGELNAWALFFLAAAGVFILSLRADVQQWAWFLVAILLFSAVSISLGNWMDRNTAIEVSDAGIQFRNGLRAVSFGWDEVQRVKVAPARWGRSVQVIGQRAFFSYNTLGEMKFKDEVKGRTGFEQGDEILAEVLRRAALTGSSKSGNITIYTR